MIDVNQLTSLISAFRVETEKESISPETVGKLLQDILDLLANASTDAERQILDDWKALLASPKAFPVRADGRFFEVGLSQAFLEICD